MQIPLLKLLIFTTSLSLFSVSLPSFAQDNPNPMEAFKTQCAKLWVERSEPTSDAVAFKNFGEKYCQCMSGKPMEPDSELDKSSRTCISEVLLADTMDNAESEEGLANVDEAKIQSRCVDELNLVYSGLLGSHAQTSSSDYCSCAAPKLDTMNKDRDNLTDQEWTDKIKSISAECSEKLTPAKAAEGKE